MHRPDQHVQHVQHVQHDNNDCNDRSDRSDRSDRNVQSCLTASHRGANRPATTAAMLLALLAGSALLPAEAAQDLPLRTESEDFIIQEGYVSGADERAADATISGLRSGTRHAASAWPPAIWIADIGASLFGDHDHDGYFSGFIISIDADVDAAQADVYASLYLARNNDYLQPFHTTGVFTLYGDSPTDRYRIEAQLLDHYPAGHYDLTIDLHDAWSGEIVDTVSAVTFRNLENLPLESDHAAPPATAVSFTVTEYAGNTGPAALVLLLLAAWRRRRTHE